MCELCDIAFRLGTFIHKLIESNLSDSSHNASASHIFLFGTTLDLNLLQIIRWNVKVGIVNPFVTPSAHHVYWYWYIVLYNNIHVLREKQF